MKIKSLVTLPSFIKSQPSQQKAADLIGVTQGGLNRAIAAKRSIFIASDGKKAYAAYEIKPVFGTDLNIDDLEAVKDFIDKNKFPT